MNRKREKRDEREVRGEEEKRRAGHNGKSSSERPQVFRGKKKVNEQKKGSLCLALLLRQRDRAAEVVIRHSHSRIG